MKIIRYIKAFLLATIISITSCTDMLDETPLSTLSSANLFENVTDVETAINGMHAGFRYYFGKLIAAYGWGVMGTDIWGRTSSDVPFCHYAYTSADSDILTAWSSMYTVINRANNIIANIDQVDATDDEKNSLVAEAYFTRAFCYMDLVQYFGGVPLRTTPTESIEEALGAPRTTEEETWALIISDLEFAEQYLPLTADPGRATKWAAKGLLSKAYLTRGGYPVGNYEEPEWFVKAAQKAYEVISESGITLNATTPGDPGAFKEYGDQFLASGENSPESIFEIQMYDEEGYGSAWGWRSINGGKSYDISDYGSYYCMWGGTILGSDYALSYNDSDIRFQWNIGPFKWVASTGTRVAMGFTSGWMPYKYRWEEIPSGVHTGPINQIILRMADIYLLFAEASNEATGNPNSSTYGMSAYEAINVVRNRAQVPEMDDTYLMKDSPYSGTDLLHGMSFESFDTSNANYDGRHVYYTGTLQERFRSAVLMERGWELMLERHRWFDLKRQGKLIEFCQGTHLLAAGLLAAEALEDPIDKSNWKNAYQLKYGSTAWPASVYKVTSNLHANSGYRDKY